VCLAKWWQVWVAGDFPSTVQRIVALRKDTMIFILINSLRSIFVSHDIAGPPGGDKDRLSAVPDIKNFERHRSKFYTI
jgi:hypothetical protein